MRYFSMFSGIGGFELGIQRAMPEAECVGYLEIDKYAIKVYEEHFKGVINYGDATKINADGLPDFDLLVGGFPCQSFSIAGKRGGFNDTRGTLFFDIARILEAKRPNTCVLENVKGLLNHDKGKTFKVIIQTLDELGYDVQWVVLNSKNFGVPQNRERVFIVGSLRGQPRPEILPFGEIISNVNESEGKIKMVINSSRQIKRIYSTEGIAPALHLNTGGWQEPKIAIPVLTPDRPIKRQTGRRFKEDGDPSFTLTGQDKHGVYDGFKIRRLTPIECERLQGFPDNWTETLSDSQRYKCLGNAVTVNVVEYVIQQIKEGEEK